MVLHLGDALSPLLFSFILEHRYQTRGSPCTGWHKKTGTFEKANKNWRNPRKKIIDRNWTITTCLL